MKDILEQLSKYDKTTLTELFEPRYLAVLKTKQRGLYADLENTLSEIESLKKKSEYYTEKLDEIQKSIVLATYKTIPITEMFSLSVNSLKILKNFVRINQGIVIEKGHTLTTMNGYKTVFGIAKIDEEFPRDVPIVDLKDFLEEYLSHQNPRLEFFDDHFMVYGETGTYTEFIYDNPSKIISPGGKRITFPTDGVIPTFVLRKEILSEIKKEQAKKEVITTFFAKDGELSVSCSNLKTWSLCHFDGEDFKVDIKGESIQCLLYGDYKCRISFQGISEMRNLSMPLVYYITYNL